MMEPLFKAVINKELARCSIFATYSKTFYTLCVIPFYSFLSTQRPVICIGQYDAFYAIVQPNNLLSPFYIFMNTNHHYLIPYQPSLSQLLILLCTTPNPYSLAQSCNKIERLFCFLLYQAITQSLGIRKEKKEK